MGILVRLLCFVIPFTNDPSPLLQLMIFKSLDSTKVSTIVFARTLFLNDAAPVLLLCHIAHSDTWHE